MDYFDLRDVTVDGARIGFVSATVTRETPWVDAGEEWVRGVSSWYGQIVSDTYPGPHVRGEYHTLAGHTHTGQMLTGRFRIAWARPRGADITGSGALFIT